MRKKMTKSVVGLWARGLWLSLLTLIFCMACSGIAFADTIFVPGSALKVTATSTKPVISSISPTSGTKAGGTQVTIIGTGFTSATGVNFGSTKGTGLTINSDRSITVKSPAGSGTVDVTVIGPRGTSAKSTRDQFRYIASTVLSLGDSIAYGMSATPGNDYVHLLYNHILTTPAYSQLSLNNLAVSGDTSSNLLTRLQTAPYIAAVGKAEVITISIGGDNLLSPIIGAVCTAFGVNRENNPNLMSDLAKAMAANPNKDTILASLVKSPTLAEALQSGVSQFATDSPEIIGKIKTLSPQAQIYVLNLYNPFNSQDPLYNVFDPLINGINQGIKDYAMAGYKVADVYTKFRTTSGAVNFNLTTLQLDPHPTTVGHAAIYQAILDAESGQIPVNYYAVSVGTLTGGSITANPVTATRGESITLTVIPATGMQLKAGTLKYNDGTADHRISGTSFVMPAKNITVSGKFEAAPTQDAAVTLAMTVPSTATANKALAITVIAKDASGNTATGYRGNVHFTSTDRLAGLPADYSFTSTDNGSHTFSVTLKTTGTKSITVKDTVTGKLKATSKITVSPVTAKMLAITAPSSAILNKILTITVRATDTLGNTATGYKGKVHFSSTDSLAGLPEDYTFKSSDKGSHTFRVKLKTLGRQSVTVTDTVTGTLKATSDNITVSSDVAAKLVITVPRTAIVNNALIITVTAKDVSRNTATGYTGKVHFASTDRLAVLPSDYTFTSADNGIHSFSVTMKTLGKKNLTVKDTVKGNLKATSNTIIVSKA